jgi:hypothetical protein
MPRDGAMILSDVRGPTLAIGCERCGRRGWRRETDGVAGDTRRLPEGEGSRHMIGARRSTKGLGLASACKIRLALNLRPGTSMSL